VFAAYSSQDLSVADARTETKACLPEVMTCCDYFLNTSNSRWTVSRNQFPLKRSKQFWGEKAVNNWHDAYWKRLV